MRKKLLSIGLFISSLGAAGCNFDMNSSGQIEDLSNNPYRIFADNETVVVFNVPRSGPYNFMKKDGTILFPDKSFENATNFQGDYASVVNNDIHRFIDINGNYKEGEYSSISVVGKNWLTVDFNNKLTLYSFDFTKVFEADNVTSSKVLYNSNYWLSTRLGYGYSVFEYTSNNNRYIYNTETNKQALIELNDYVFFYEFGGLIVNNPKTDAVSFYNQNLEHLTSFGPTIEYIYFPGKDVILAEENLRTICGNINNYSKKQVAVKNIYDTMISLNDADDGLTTQYVVGYNKNETTKNLINVITGKIIDTSPKSVEYAIKDNYIEVIDNDSKTSYVLDSDGNKVSVDGQRIYTTGTDIVYYFKNGRIYITDFRKSFKKDYIYEATSLRIYYGSFSFSTGNEMIVVDMQSKEIFSAAVTLQYKQYFHEGFFVDLEAGRLELYTKEGVQLNNSTYPNTRVYMRDNSIQLD